MNPRKLDTSSDVFLGSLNSEIIIKRNVHHASAVIKAALMAGCYMGANMSGDAAAAAFLSITLLGFLNN